MVNNSIAASMPKNRLGLFDNNGNVLIEPTLTFLEMSRNQLAKALGLTPDQLRPDRIGPKTQEKVGELASALEFVAESFGGDTDKASFWIKTPNMQFGGTSPRNLILRGRYKRVLQFILSAQSA